jgi:hypothetical protein
MRNLTYAYILVGELSGWTEAQPYTRSPRRYAPRDDGFLSRTLF